MKSFFKMWCLLIGLTTIVCSCTRTSVEIRYCVQNQLAEKIEIHYGYSEIEYSRWCDCAYLILHEHMDTIPAQQTHRLLIPQKFHDAPENTFDSSMRARYKEILYLIGNTATIQKIQAILIGR